MPGWVTVGDLKSAAGAAGEPALVEEAGGERDG
jgi:hypothetical protein